jgi:hypothetical protein
MHATQPQGGTCPDPTAAPDATAAQLVGILTDPDRFRACIAAQLGEPSAEPDATTDAGNVVTDAGRRALAEAPAEQAPGTAGSVLRSAAVYLERHGWIQGSYYDTTATVFTPAACLVGAIGMVCYGGPVDAPAQHFDDPGFLDFEEAVLHLDRYLLVEDGSESYAFNDVPGRRVEDVLRVLRQAADTPAEELIDAIRAIDAKNAEVATLVDLLIPSGAFAATEQPKLVGSHGRDAECSRCQSGCASNNYNGYADPGAFGHCGCSCHRAAGSGGDGA